MRGSPYAGPFEERVNTWVTTLQRVHDVFDEWVSCQRLWIYMYPIFSSPDIGRDIAADATRFKAVDTQWRRTMVHAEETRRVPQPHAADSILTLTLSLVLSSCPLSRPQPPC